jgi:hypothetical protein
MRGGRLAALLLLTALLAGIGLALIMKRQKSEWRARHPRPEAPAAAPQHQH